MQIYNLQDLGISCVSTGSNIPKGVIQKGTLSNQKLIQDTKHGVVLKVATLGCDKVESFDPYVLVMPQGTAGSRYWYELWLVKGCNSEYPIRIRFSEDGLNAANYVIE